VAHARCDVLGARVCFAGIKSATPTSPDTHDALRSRGPAKLTTAHADALRVLLVLLHVRGSGLVRLGAAVTAFLKFTGDSMNRCWFRHFGELLIVRCLLHSQVIADQAKSTNALRDFLFRQHA